MQCSAQFERMMPLAGRTTAPVYTYDSWPYDAPPLLRANVDIIPFLPIQLSRHPQPLTTFPQNEALGIKSISEIGDWPRVHIISKNVSYVCK